MPIQLKEHKKTQAPTAGPSADDRGGFTPGGKRIDARLQTTAGSEGNRSRIMVSSGSSQGVVVGMSGYIKEGVDGVLATFVIEAVEANRSYAWVDVDATKLRANAFIVINTSPPKSTVAGKPRIIAHQQADTTVEIIISHGADQGLFEGMQGKLVAADGKSRGFTITKVDARKSYIYFEHATLDELRPFSTVELARPSAPVQRRANGATASTAAVESTAQAGVAGASSQLPFLDVIQRSFGKHDVSGVRAQIGGPATDASSALGARAYATGSTVAFASAPDLHTAAHEAAHTVQQARGAVGFQGLGAADDEHERHADAVADAVVAGRSAEALLDGVGGSGSSTAIQRHPSRHERFGEQPARPGVFELHDGDLTKSRDGFTGSALAVSRSDRIPPTARGSTTTMRITVANMTAASVEVSAQIAPPTQERSFEKSAAFRIVSLSTRHLEPDALTEVTIAFTPRSVGDFDAVLELSTARDTRILRVPLSGSGVETEQDRSARVRDEAEKKKAAETARRTEDKANADAFRKHVGPIVEVDVVETEDLSHERGLRFEQMCERSIKLIGAGLRNVQLALSNFESVVRSPSAKETVTESNARIIFTEIVKHYQDHVASYLLKALPFGSEIGEFLAFGSWSEAIGNEKQRSKQAGEDHQVMRFLVRTREWLGNVHRKLDSGSTAMVHRRGQVHQSLDDAHQALERNDIMIANERYDRELASGRGSVRGSFEMIVCEWTKHTKVPNSTRDAHVRILYDADWNLMFASLEASRGERLAEELMRDGREVDLQTLPVRRVVEWKPFLRTRSNPLPHQAAMFLSREIDDTGEVVETRYSELAHRLKPEFEARVSGMMLPKVKELKGTSVR